MHEVLFRVEQLSKRFPDGKCALVDINLEIREKEFLLIAGSNGSGKTLLMRMLIGLGTPSSGTVFFKNVRVLDNPQIVRRQVGLVFQDADSQIVGETVEEDVSFGPNNLKLDKKTVQERVDAALEATGLSQKRTSLPRTLSGGEKRRLAVAGVLALGSSTIIFDEPFANLDWPGVQQVLLTMKNLKEEGKTLIVLTHELEKVLSLADRLLLLDKGSVMDDGSPHEVLERGIAAYGVRDPRHNYEKIEDCTWI